MKKMTTLATIALLVASTIFPSCQKETTTSTPPVSSSTLAGTYKVTAMQLQPTAGPSQDLFTNLPDCQKQTLQTLRTDFSYQLQSVCNPGDNATSVWALQGTNKITINGLTGDLVSFDGRNLVLGFDNFFGMPGRLTETLTKQ